MLLFLLLFVLYNSIVSQFLIYVPLLTFDERRIAKKRNFCLCCIKHDKFVKGSKSHELTNVHTDNSVEMIKNIGNINQQSTTSVSTGSNKGATTGDTGKKEEQVSTSNINKNTNTSKPQICSMEYAMINGLVPLLNKRWFRICIFLLFGTILVLSIISLSWINTETDVNKLLPDDSFLLDFINAQIDGFGRIIFTTVYFIIKNSDFSDINTHSRIINMMNTFENNFDSKYGEIVSSMNNWIDEFDIWLSSSSSSSNYYNQTDDGISGFNGINELVYNGTKSEYYDLLDEFINTTYDGRVWNEYIKYNYYDNNNGSIKNILATRFNGQFKVEFQVKRRWNLYPDLRDTFNNEMGGESSGYVYGGSFMPAYLANIIVSLSVNNLIFAAIGVFSILAILMDLRMAVFLVLIIAMIDFGMYSTFTLLNTHTVYNI